jgi:hypothetical protein
MQTARPRDSRWGGQKDFLVLERLVSTTDLHTTLCQMCITYITSTAVQRLSVSPGGFEHTDFCSRLRAISTSD